MEPNPYLPELTDPYSTSSLGSEPDSQSDFEFPTALAGAGSNSAVSSDIVFCGKVIGGQTEPGPPRRRKSESENPLVLRSESFGNLKSGGSNRFTAWVRSPSARENRYRRSGSSQKHCKGMFGTAVKFPLQMELSDIKMRQERREPLRPPLPKFPAEGDGELVTVGGGGESCWELVRPLRRRAPLMSFLAKASFGCIPLV